MIKYLSGAVVGLIIIALTAVAIPNRRYNSAAGYGAPRSTVWLTALADDTSWATGQCIRITTNGTAGANYVPGSAGTNTRLPADYVIKNLYWVIAVTDLAANESYEVYLETGTQSDATVAFTSDTIEVGPTALDDRGEVGVISPNRSESAGNWVRVCSQADTDDDCNNGASCVSPSSPSGQFWVEVEL